MTLEKSCGAVVYRKFHGNTEILLIRHEKSGYWSFPKGHIEDGETEEQTALREIKEETGLDVFIDSGFRETVIYSPRRDASKTVVYFIAKSKNGDVLPREGEISDTKWVEIDKAAGHLTYDNDRVIVSRAKAFMSLMKY
ncbi:MAG: NUDIX domain-containing protein [Oscillospiraceae bacterium]|nr:NUDIX domain-containing protein [Oscillospiraceae bacterium]